MRSPDGGIRGQHCGHAQEEAVWTSLRTEVEADPTTAENGRNSGGHLGNSQGDKERNMELCLFYRQFLLWRCPSVIPLVIGMWIRRDTTAGSSYGEIQRQTVGQILEITLRFLKQGYRVQVSICTQEE